jgi:hypothetical protein
MNRVTFLSTTVRNWPLGFNFSDSVNRVAIDRYKFTKFHLKNNGSYCASTRKSV